MGGSGGGNTLSVRACPLKFHGTVLKDGDKISVTWRMRRDLKRVFSDLGKDVRTIIPNLSCLGFSPQNMAILNFNATKKKISLSTGWSDPTLQNECVTTLMLKNNTLSINSSATAIIEDTDRRPPWAKLQIEISSSEIKTSRQNMRFFLGEKYLRNASFKINWRDPLSAIKMEINSGGSNMVLFSLLLKSPAWDKALEDAFGSEFPIKGLPWMTIDKINTDWRLALNNRKHKLDIPNKNQAQG